MNKLTKLIKHTLFYGLTHGIEALVPFLFLIILTRYLSSEEYGIWTLFTSLYAFVMPFIGLKFDDAVKIHFPDLKGNHLARFVCSAVFLTTILSLAALLIILIAPEFFAKITLFPQHWLWSIIVVAFLYSVHNIVRAIYQFKEDRKALIVTLILQVIITLVVSLSFLISGAGYSAAILGTAAGLAGSLLLSIVIFKPDLPLHFLPHIDKAHISTLAKFGLIYFPAALGAVIIPLTDRLFIAHMVSLEDTGFYSIATLFGSVLNMIVTGAFIFAWLPWMFKLLSNHDQHGRKIVMIGTVIFYVGLPIIGFILIAVSLFVAPYLMNATFLQATQYIYWLVIAAVVQGYFTHNLGYLMFVKKTGYISLCTIIVIMLNIIFNYLFVKEFGTVGIAYATIVAYTVAAFVSGVIILILRKRKLFRATMTND